jgi:AraC family transcriptional regulator of adaptative response / DNA-3-methyladenine glycosylase II
MDDDEACDAAARVARACGRPFAATNGLTHLFPEPRVLADADLVRFGLSKACAQTVCALARAVADDRVRFDGVVDSDAFLARLRAVTGMDAWTAQLVAMRALGEPDAFPFEGSGERGGSLSNGTLEERAEAWRPWRAYAAMYLMTGAGAAQRPSVGPARAAPTSRAELRAGM